MPDEVFCKVFKKSLRLGFLDIDCMIETLLIVKRDYRGKEAMVETHSVSLWK